MGRDVILHTGAKGVELFATALEKQAMGQVGSDMENMIMWGPKSNETKLLNLPEIASQIPEQHLAKLKELAKSKMNDDKNLVIQLLTKFVPNLKELADSARIPLKEEELSGQGLWQQLQQGNAIPYVKNPFQPFKFELVNFFDRVD